MPYVFPTPPPTITPFSTSAPPSVSPTLSPSQKPSPLPSATPSPSPSPSISQVYDTELAREKMTLAKQLLEKGDAEGAVRELDAAGKLRLPPFMVSTVAQLLEDAKTCRDMMDSVEISPALQGGKIVVVYLKGAGKVEGVIEKEDADSITVRTSGGVIFTLKRNEIDRITPMDVEIFKNQNRAVLVKLVAGAKRREDEGWLSWWKAFKFARKFDLNPDLWNIYCEMDTRWADLPGKLSDYNAFQLYRLSLHYFSRGMDRSAIEAARKIIEKYSGTRYADGATELLQKLGVIETPKRTPQPVPSDRPLPSDRPVPSDRPTPSNTPKPSKSPSASPTPSQAPSQSRVIDPPKETNDELKKANGMYAKAKKLVQSAFDAMDDDDYKKAIDNFEAAITQLESARTIYENEFAMDPRRTDIGDFIEQVNKMLYLCRKSKPLGVWN